MDNVDELVIDFVTAQNGRRDYYAGRNIAAEMKAIEDEMKGVAKQNEVTAKQQAKLNSEMKKTTTQATLLSRAFHFLGGYLAVSKISQYADEWAKIKSTLAVITENDKQRIDVQEKLYEISKNTRTATSETVDLFTKLTMNSESLNLSQEKRLKLTELINKALIAGGGGVDENKRVLLQFGQALGVGRFQGQDLKSILQNNIGFAKTIAEGLGVDVGKLTEMGSKGELTAEKVVNAIFKQQDAINNKYRKTSITIKQSLQIVNDAFLRFIGKADETFGASTKIAKGLELIADNIGILANIGVLMLLPKIFTSIKASLTAIVPLLKYLKVGAVIYSWILLYKLLKNLFNLFTGKKNVFEDFWTVAIKRTEQRLKRLPKTISEVLETIGLDFEEWTTKNMDTWWGKLFSFLIGAAKTPGQIGGKIGEGLVNLAHHGTWGDESWSERQRRQDFERNLYRSAGVNSPVPFVTPMGSNTVNQNVNITVNEATQGKQAVVGAVNDALKQTIYTNGYQTLMNY